MTRMTRYSESFHLLLSSTGSFRSSAKNQRFRVNLHSLMIFVLLIGLTRLTSTLVTPETYSPWEIAKETNPTITIIGWIRTQNLELVCNTMSLNVVRDFLINRTFDTNVDINILLMGQYFNKLVVYNIYNSRHVYGLSIRSWGIVIDHVLCGIKKNILID